MTKTRLEFRKLEFGIYKSMLATLTRVKEGLLDIFLPKKCVGCGREGEYICDKCEVFLSEMDPILGNPISQISGNQEIRFPVISVWEYEGLMEKLIHKIKFDGQYHIIDELTEKALNRIELNLPEDVVITYVPMFKKRERQRGFNQAELIAKKMGERTGQPMVRLLKKIKDNRSQVGLSPPERIENVKDAFKYLPRVSHPREVQNVLLVDDVYTTGATMNECIRVLKQGGIKNIWGFTLSRKMSIQNC